MSEKASVPSVEVLLQQAMARLQAREFRAAAPLFQRAIALGSDTPEIRNNLGQALRFSGDTGGAEAAFREALRQRPAYVRAAANLAALLLPKRADAATEVLLLYLPPAREKRCTAPLRSFGKMLLGQIRRFTIWKRC